MATEDRFKNVVIATLEKRAATSIWVVPKVRLIRPDALSRRSAEREHIANENKPCTYAACRSGGSMAG